MKSIYWASQYHFMNPAGGNVLAGYHPNTGKPIYMTPAYKEALKKNFFSQFVPGEHVLAIIPDHYGPVHKWEEFLKLPEMEGKLIYKSPKFNNANHNKEVDYLTLYIFKM